MKENPSGRITSQIQKEQKRLWEVPERQHQTLILMLYLPFPFLIVQELLRKKI